jgi:hypothetical protein
MITMIKNNAPTVILMILIILSIGWTGKTEAQSRQITNDTFWKTVTGDPIFSQGGGIFKFRDPQSGQSRYYWYGVHYVEADQYLNNPSKTLSTPTFESVTCYSSTDLINWTFEGNVLTKDRVNQQGNTWVGRLGVAYIAELNKYAMFVQHGAEVLITMANTPAGEFQWHQKINMKQMIGTTNTGDQTVFTDEDTGKSYLVYSYGRGRNKIYISEIGVKNGKVDLLDCTQIFQGESREGNCMFKYGNKFYMCASNIYGWDSSFAYYLVADNIHGPYLPTGKMLEMKGATQDYAHVSQTGFFYVLKGSKQETVIYCGDRWADFAGNGLGYNQWCPISFQGSVPYFHSLSSWSLDPVTAEWSIAGNNNYVKNGSFEADRKRIPSIVKPVQTELTGWTTKIYNGNEVSLDSLNSPVLNYFNTGTDRKIVVGEKSLYISDNIDYKRTVSQLIGSSGTIALDKGYYILSAKIRNSSEFSQLRMFARSDNKEIVYNIKQENKTWSTICIERIPVNSGIIEIGFSVWGKANAYCIVDDISLIKQP